MNSPHVSHTSSRAIRGVLFLLLGLGASVAQAGIKSERVLASIIKHTPASTLVDSGQQMKQAERAAAQIPGAEVLWGVGESMAPLFSSHTAIVVAPAKFKELQKGMTVVYVNRYGHMVAHSLTGDVPKGWIAQGVNNDEEDDDLVTKDNLVGVIVQAFSEIPSEFRVTLTKQLVAKGRLPANQS
ncbi:MAG TPA: hypothetical protein VHD62_05585 [Opitutaceae bacterium]|nr:hypothetical protein [Opitutaceae bacterium]